MIHAVDILNKCRTTRLARHVILAVTSWTVRQHGPPCLKSGGKPYLDQPLVSNAPNAPQCTIRAPPVNFFGDVSN